MIKRVTFVIEIDAFTFSRRARQQQRCYKLRMVLCAACQPCLMSLISRVRWRWLVVTNCRGTCEGKKENNQPQSVKADTDKDKCRSLWLAFYIHTLKRVHRLGVGGRCAVELDLGLGLFDSIQQ